MRRQGAAEGGGAFASRRRGAHLFILAATDVWWCLCVARAAAALDARGVWQADQQSEEEIRKKVVRQLGSLECCTAGLANEVEGSSVTAQDRSVPRCVVGGTACELCEACDDLFVLMDNNSSGGVDVYELEEGMLAHWQVKFSSEQLMSQVRLPPASLSRARGRQQRKQIETGGEERGEDREAVCI